MFTPHPKLAKPPLREAKFELTLTEGTQASLIFDALTNDIGQNSYKSLIKRHVTINVNPEDDLDTISKNIQEQFIARDKVIISNDGHVRFLFDKNLFSYGVRSSYTGWEDFRSNLQNILLKYSGAAEDIKYTSLSLWFINAIPWEREKNGDLEVERLKSILRNWLILKEIPKSFSESVSQVSSNIAMEGEAGVKKIEVAYPAYDDVNSVYVHLKIEVIAEFEEDQELSVDEILEWADIAHAEIHTAFVKSLSIKYYKEIQ